MTISKSQLHHWQAVSEAAPDRISQALGHGAPTPSEVFYAAAREAVPALLAEVERLRRLADDMCTNLALRGYPNLAAHFRKDLSHE